MWNATRIINGEEWEIIDPHIPEEEGYEYQTMEIDVPMPYTWKAINLFLTAGCKTNIHYVLSNSSIVEATRRLREDDFPEGINAVIFLLHKPVGAGSIDEVLKPNDPRLVEFFSHVHDKHPFKIGFDSCTVPAIINLTGDRIMPESVDTCEGGRWSCYIGPDMTMVPCSFDQEKNYGVSLRDHTIQEAWDSPEFIAFRDVLRQACPTCQQRESCMGGCPIKNEIVICERPERS